MSSDESIRTPSPGRDYSSLLNDSTESIEETPENSEAAYLKAQLDLLSSQKHMHIDMHAKQVSGAEREKQELERVLREEREKFKRDLEAITTELLEVKSSFNALTKKKKQEAETLQHKLKAQEEYFLKVIYDKDQTISKLRQKVHSKPPVKKESKEYVQGISKLIVTLEKELAELRQRTKSEKHNKKLWELISRNENRLTEARTIQEDLIKSKMFGKLT